MTSALESHSPLQQPILHITITVMAILFAILVLVAVLLVIASVKYRQRASGREPHQNFGNAKLEITWTALPFLLLVAIFVLTVIAMRAADPPTAMSGGDDPPPDIVVVGHQFWWEFRYAEGFVAANEMHVPVGRRLLLRIEAADVIHDFWVPALGRKMDAIPGSPNQMYFEAGEPGEYGGTCAEFCGAEHAWMRLLVIAQPQKEYEAWVREQQAKPASPTEGDALRGKQIFGTTSCATCHAVSGVTSARVGPDLTHLASRQTLAAGRMPNNPANLEAWLRNPEKFKPGSYMPNALLSQQDLTALVAYLETLR